MLKDLLETKKCFKLVCGAGNEDIEEVKRLVFIYALAGCKFFDLSANKEIIVAAKESIKLAQQDDCYFCASIGIKGDPHMNKAVIDYNKCINCGSCESVCPQNAIIYTKVNKQKCIGCSRCWKVCPRNAISFTSEEKKLDEILPFIKKEVDCIEFHIDGQDENEIFSKWKFLNEEYNGLLSICISRGFLGDKDFIERIENMISIRKPKTTIIQADGFPMSGGEDDYKTTLQAIASGEIVQNAKLPVYLMLSGGTNSKTKELAKLCSIDYNGIAVGSFARKIIMYLIQRKDFWKNENIINEAVEKASLLVKAI